MTPGDLGYVKCFRCDTWRRPGTTTPVGLEGIEGRACNDGCRQFIAHAGSPSVDCPCGMPLHHASACGFTVDPEAT